MNKLETAIQLRKNGELQKSNKILLEIIKEHKDDAIINYQCAWSFDVLGKEKEAIPYYEKAIEFYSDRLDEIFD